MYVLVDCYQIFYDALPADSTVNHSCAAKARRPVNGKKVVITTGRLPQHDADTRPLTLPRRSRQTSSRSVGRCSRGRDSQRQVASKSATTTRAEVDDDEWEVVDVKKISRESTTEICDKLRSTVPQRIMQPDVTQEQINSGSLLTFVL